MAFLLTVELSPRHSQAAAAPEEALAPGAVQQSSVATGPTMRLDYEPGKSTGNPIASFMYFVPLISPELVSSQTSPGSTQSAQVTSAKRRLTAHSFLTTCEFEFSGQGSQQSLFDLTDKIRRHERKLKGGGSIRRQLSSITVEGAGKGTVEVEGTVSNGIQTVTEVRLRFNAHGTTSPVSIGLCDIRYLDGEFKYLKEIVAQVNTLTFRRKPGPPKMEVTVASVRKKGAGKSLWQSIKGGITGAAANLLLDPLSVEATGHQAMLDFGQALVSGAPTFTFPHARNLKETFAGQPTPLLKQPAGGVKRLLVIAPSAFHPALQEFVAHKQKLEPTELRSLEKILEQSRGVDDPEKLKRFLYDEWRQRGLGYALLVGDVDVLPVRYMVLDRVTPAAFDYAFYPSDLYYSDLAKADGSFDDWNARKDSFHAGYFGEVRGEKNKQDPINYDQVDYLPDIAVGRWPVSTPDEVRLVAGKTISYEQQVLAKSSPHLHQAAFFAVGGWMDSRKLMDRLAATLTNAWRIEKRYYSDAGQPAATPPPDHNQLRAVLNDGASLIVHAGHGQADAWERCFSLADLDHITNSARLPVVISAGCSTAYFAPLAPYGAYVDIDGKEHAGTDNKEVFTAPPPPPSPYQRGRFNPTGLGEQVLKRGPNGAVAYIGCNTGSQPCGLTLVEGFVTALAEAKEPRLGECWASAIRHYFDKEHLATLKPNADWYPPSIFFQGMKFMLFGDPSLRLPANRP